MTFRLFDFSTQNAQPVELYEFRQALTVWRYTSGPRPFTLTGIEYEPVPIVRSNIAQSKEVSGSSLSLKFPRDHVFAAQFLGATPDLVTTLTIFRGHSTDPDKEFQTYWKGRVVAGKANGSEITLECESVFTSLKRMGLRAAYQRTCRHTLYSGACGVSMNNYKAVATVQSVSGSNMTLTITGTFADGYFTGGIAKLPSGATRFILSHTSAGIVLSRPFTEDARGATIELFAGCDHLKATCMTKFNNLLNFGGFPYIPNVNPFGGSRIA